MFTDIINAFLDWQKDKVNLYAAAISYYSLFSLGPLILIMISVAGFFFGTQASTRQILLQISHFTNPAVAQTVKSLIQQGNSTDSNLISLTIGIVLLLFSASSIFSQLEEAFNVILHIKDQPSGIKSMLINRIMTFIVLFIIALALLVSLVFSTVISYMSQYVFKNMSLLLYSLDIIIPLIIFALILPFLYMLLSRVKLSYNLALQGAVISSILFTFGKIILSYMIALSASSSKYGTTSSLIALLLWIYYSSLILLYGLEYVKIKYYHLKKKR